MAKTNLKIKKGSLVRLILDESGVQFLGIALKKVSHKNIDTFLPDWLNGIQSGKKIWHIYDIENEDLIYVWENEIREVLNEAR
jgi:hypothetical protein